MFAEFSITPERLVVFLDPLDPSVIANFAERDSKTGAKAHEWLKPDYSALKGENYDLNSNNTGGSPEPVALTEVLKAMEEVRDTFHLRANTTNPFTNGKVTKTDFNVVDRGTVESCLGNPTPHWSDLTVHYYCLHAGLRGCYTGGVRSTGEYLQGVRADEAGRGPKTADELNNGIACRLPVLKLESGKLAPVAPNDLQFRFPTLRRYVYSHCAVSSSTELPKQTGPTNFIPGCENRNDIFAYAPTSDERTAFAWLEKEGGFGSFHARVFRYLMEAPTFAFDAQDQQDIINAFWRVKDPSNPMECAKRPTRAVDRPDGTHCLANKVQNPPLAPANR